jgi:hypothetical protein
MTNLHRLAAWILGGLAAVLLAGCAGPRYTDMATAMPPLQPGLGRIVLYTPDVGTAAGAPQPKIRISQRVVGRAKSGSFFYVDRPAGNYTVAADRNNKDVLRFALEAGDIRYVRFVQAVPGTPNSGSVVATRLRPELVETAAAESQLRSTRYWGASSRTRKELAAD